MTADLSKAFWQKRVKPEQAKLQVIWLPHISNEEKNEFASTGKISNKGAPPKWVKYQVNSLLQGSPNGSAISQASNEEIIRDCNLSDTTVTLIHIDDTYIFTKNLEEHKTEVRKYLNTCREKGIKLSKDKFVAIAKTNFPLSNRWEAGTLRVPEGYLKSIPDKPSNTDLLRLTQSLLYCGYFIPNFAIKTTVQQHCQKNKRLKKT